MANYSVERNVQILIAVMKANNIRKVVISPGATNISFVASLVSDGGFELYSAVDERGAAYMACGMSSESGEPVVITCTGATASRNYLPAMTEAYHRKLPIIAVTASQDLNRCGNLSPQFIDRSVVPTDSALKSVQIPIVRNEADEYKATLDINSAVLETNHHGGGPVHINLASEYSNDFSVNELRNIRILRRYTYGDLLPEINNKARVAIIVGNHKQFSETLTKAIDDFCGKYDAAVLVDHSSHYWGKYRILPTISTCQENHRSPLFDIDLLIHIGEEHGDYYTEPVCKRVKEVWRVSPDGKIRDPFHKLTNTFEMSEEFFFAQYAKGERKDYRTDYYTALKHEIKTLYNLVPELPFSNIWIAQKIIPRFPSDACLEIGVSNTMRSWTFFDFEQETYTLANTGCRGIDGAIPTLVGMSLVNPEKLHFAVMGDLTFFYSFNVLGERHVGKNLRIILINNGTGGEFNIYQHRAYKIYDGDRSKINQFVAAGGHVGTKSKLLVKHYAEDLGMEYLTASSKDDFNRVIDRFMDKSIKKSMIFEVFTDVELESAALKKIRTLKTDNSQAIKGVIKSILGR